MAASLRGAGSHLPRVERLLVNRHEALIAIFIYGFHTDDDIVDGKIRNRVLGDVPHPGRWWDGSRRHNRRHRVPGFSASAALHHNRSRPDSAWGAAFLSVRRS